MTEYRCPDCGWSAIIDGVPKPKISCEDCDNDDCRNDPEEECYQFEYECLECGSLNTERKLPDGRWWKADRADPIFIVREVTTKERIWGPDDTYVVIPEIQVLGAMKGRKFKVTIEEVE